MLLDFPFPPSVWLDNHLYSHWDCFFNFHLDPTNTRVMASASCSYLVFPLICFMFGSFRYIFQIVHTQPFVFLYPREKTRKMIRETPMINWLKIIEQWKLLKLVKLLKDGNSLGNGALKRGHTGTLFPSPTSLQNMIYKVIDHKCI